MLINVNTIMVKGADDGAAANKQDGKIHYIQLSLIKDGKYDLIMPCLEESIKEKERLKTIINRIRGLNNIDHLRFRIDLRIDEDGNLNYQEQLDDLKSLELSIGIGIQASYSWKEKWDTIWKKWSFSGVIDGLNCEIRKIAILNAKLDAAVFKDDDIKYIMIPSENRQEAIKWAENEGIGLEKKIGANTQIADKRKRSFPCNVWSLATRNTLTQIALVMCLLSITYLPIRYLLWDYVQSLGKDGSHIIINLPIKNPGKTKERLLNYGFLKNQIKDTPLLSLSKSLVKTNRSGRVLITNKKGVIEFEIINPRDWTLVLSYICCGYIAVFALVIIIFAIKKNNGSTKYNRVNINYDSILLTDKDKEIVFVDNMKQAEAIIEHKIQCAA